MLLLERKLADKEKTAHALILEGRVKVKGRVIEKPGTLVDSNSEIEIISKTPYVSRGGLKLEGVFQELGLSAAGKKAVDIGSSTGGFTDFLLKNGVEKIIDIDVGYGQLSWEIRNSPQVVVFERTNIRHLDIGKLPFIADFTVVDVSFISIKKIFSKILELTAKNGEILLLVKPQFELKKDEVESKGIIRNRKLHYKVLLEVTEFIKEFPVEIKSFTFSKIKGAKGNIEFWIFLIKSFKEAKSILNYDKIIEDVVDRAHLYFNQSG
ncbi:MAG: TlyA family RNA methyltransferase [Candidatus Hydromicrobium sp.]|nr:TlyA family RNA methyltransferase [Candidatus Hydromicrobium sp.]